MEINICKQPFDRIQEGDILVCSNAGCDNIAAAVSRLEEYMELVRKHKSGILCFEDTLLERCMTKGDVFLYHIGEYTYPQTSDIN